MRSRERLVTALEDRKRLAYVRYRGGVDTQLNALDADRDLFQAQLSLAQIRYDELLSVVQLYKALERWLAVAGRVKGIMNRTLDRFRRLMAGLLLGLLLLAGPVRAASLRSDTIAAWDRYTESVIAQMHERERPGGHYLWAAEDKERMARVRSGEIVIAPAAGPNPRKVPGGLIHHWMGAAFLPWIDS